MDNAIIVLFALCFGGLCLALVALFMLWDKVHYGSVAPAEEVLWPVDHPKYSRHRCNRDRRN